MSTKLDKLRKRNNGKEKYAFISHMNEGEFPRNFLKRESIEPFIFGRFDAFFCSLSPMCSCLRDFRRELGGVAS